MTGSNSSCCVMKSGERNFFICFLTIYIKRNGPARNIAFRLHRNIFRNFRGLIKCKFIVFKRVTRIPRLDSLGFKPFPGINKAGHIMSNLIFLCKILPGPYIYSRIIPASKPLNRLEPICSFYTSQAIIYAKVFVIIYCGIAFF